ACWKRFAEIYVFTTGQFGNLPCVLGLWHRCEKDKHVPTVWHRLHLRPWSSAQASMRRCGVCKQRAARDEGRSEETWEPSHAMSPTDGQLIARHGLTYSRLQIRHIDPPPVLAQQLVGRRPV